MEEIHECARCGRRLRSAKAIKDGMGKVCKDKSMAEKAFKPKENTATATHD